MLFCCLWRNFDTSFHKHFAVFPAINKHRRLLPAISVTTCGTVVRRRRIDNIWPIAALRARTETIYWLRIAISAYPIWIRRLHQGSSCWNIAMPFGTEKLEWLGYPMVKNFEDMFIRCDTIHECDGQTDGHTDTAWRLRPCLMLASCGNNNKSNTNNNNSTFSLETTYFALTVYISHFLLFLY